MTVAAVPTGMNAGVRISPRCMVMAPVREREHLETAGIGEDRPVPAREAVQAAVRLDDLEAGPQVEMERVAEDDVGA